MVIVFSLSQLPVFQVKTVVVEGSDNTELQQEFQSLVGGSVFSRNLTRTVDRWLARDQSLSELRCRRGLPDTITCVAKSRQPSLIWLREGKEFLVDGQGLLYAEKGPQPLGIPSVEDKIGEEASVGSDVISGEIASQVVTLDSLLREREITVNRFFIQDSVYQIGATITGWTDSGGTSIQKELSVLFVSTESLEAQIKTLHSLLLQRGADVAKQIDLRVPGYVYYQ